ncbi:MAG: hypothetical protein WC526_02045 [Patescibacteria group bacterium]
MTTNIAPEKFIRELLDEEMIEVNFINLYMSLLDLRVEQCIDAKKQKEFRKGMEILHSDSQEHRRIIENIIRHYEKK